MPSDEQVPMAAMMDGGAFALPPSSGLHIRSQTTPSPRRRSMQRWVRNNGAPLMMCLPVIVFTFIFCYLPLPGIIIAFKEYRIDQGIFGSQWVGFYNFKFLFNPAAGIRITVNTIMYHFIFLVAGLITSLTLALLMNEIHSKLRARFYQSAMFLPNFISWIIVAYFVYAFLNYNDGLANRIISALGGEPILWYNRPEPWPAILTIVNTWHGAGFGSILYLAVMIGISPELYEAARMDGAGKLQEIRHITLPMLVPIIVIQFLLSIGHMLKANFSLFYAVPMGGGGAIAKTTSVIDTFVYRALASSQGADFGMAAAAGLYQSAVGFVLVLLSNWLVRRVDPDRALF